jgi:two-component system, NtrC family, sensor kinase
MPTSGSQYATNQLEAYTSRSFLLLVIAVCALPAVLNFAGVDFATPNKAINLTSLAEMSEQGQTGSLIQNLGGCFVHTILEWSAFVVAMITAIIAFTHYRLVGDFVTPLIGVALFAAGVLDAFHVLAADQLIHSVADDRQFIPFTWAISRLFAAVILTVGAMFLILLKPKRGDDDSIVIPDVRVVVAGCLFQRGARNTGLSKDCQTGAIDTKAETILF